MSEKLASRLCLACSIIMLFSLIAGCARSGTTALGAVKIILGLRNFVFYLLYCAFFALIAGVLVDWIF